MSFPGDIAKDLLVNPIKKLGVGIKDAIGRRYDPEHLKKMADAKVYEINKISEAIRDNSDVPIKYENNGVAIDSTQYDDLVIRAQGRLAYQETRKQENIESVAGKAMLLLEDSTPVPNIPMDADWVVRFFNSVEDISDDDMQSLWARVLAGEVKQPGSFSLRTLEVLHNMTKSEAEEFTRICQHILLSNSQYYVDCDAIRKYEGVTYDTILSMDDCGIMYSNSLIAYSERFNKQKKLIIRNNSIAIMAENKNAGEYEISFAAFPLTVAGYQLANMIGVTTSDEEILALANDLARSNPNIIISVNSVVFKEDGIFEYEFLREVIP